MTKHVLRVGFLNQIYVAIRMHWNCVAQVKDYSSLSSKKYWDLTLKLDLIVGRFLSLPVQCLKMRMMKSWLSIFEFWELEFAFSFTFDKKSLSPSHILTTEASSKVHLIIFLVLYGLSLVDYTDLHFIEIDDKIIYVVP